MPIKAYLIAHPRDYATYKLDLFQENLALHGEIETFRFMLLSPEPSILSEKNLIQIETHMKEAQIVLRIKPPRYILTDQLKKEYEMSGKLGKPVLHLLTEPSIPHPDDSPFDQFILYSSVDVKNIIKKIKKICSGN